MYVVQLSRSAIIDVHDISFSRFDYSTLQKYALISWTYSPPEVIILLPNAFCSVLSYYLLGVCV